LELVAKERPPTKIWRMLSPPKNQLPTTRARATSKRKKRKMEKVRMEERTVMATRRMIVKGKVDREAPAQRPRDPSKRKRKLQQARQLAGPLVAADMR
jgi:hypothetical protein